VSGAGRRRAGPSSEFCAAGAPHSADAARSRSGVSRIAGSAGTTTPEFPQLQQCTASPASLPPRLGLWARVPRALVLFICSLLGPAGEGYRLLETRLTKHPDHFAGVIVEQDG
jgi:hypothetical protein